MRALLLLCTYLFLGGCSYGAAGGELLSLADLSLRRWSQGDSIEVSGSGFPEHRRCSLELQGTARAAGRPARTFHWSQSCESTTQQELSFVLEEGFLARFFDGSPDLAHGTFEGELRVAFPPARPGAPPVSGTLRGVRVELLRGGDPEALRRQRLAARAFGDYLGLTLGDGTLRIQELKADGRAARAGLLVGDELDAFRGVTLLGLEDLRPAAGEDQAEMLLRRGPMAEPFRLVVATDGFQPPPLGELALPLLILVLAAGILLVPNLPVGRILRWTERRMVQRLRAGRRDQPWLARLLQQIVDDQFPFGAKEGTGMRWTPPLVFLVVSASLTLVALDRALLQVDQDLPLILLLATSGVVSSGLVLGGWSHQGSWSFRQGGRAAAGLAVFQLAAVLSVVCVVLPVGSLRFRSLVLAQGGWPWEWSLFRNPTLLFAFGLMLLACIPQASRGYGPLPESEQDRGTHLRTSHGATRLLTFLAEWVHLFVICGLAAALYLGGWRVPGIALERQGQDRWLLTLGALLFQLKTWGLAFLVLTLRWVLPSVHVKQIGVLAVRWVLPASLWTALVSWGWWVAERRGNPVHDLQWVFALVLCLLTLLQLSALLWRVVRRSATTEPDAELNPWL